ncbi:MAG: restriction endonuclease subunit S [Actinomycetes bacterium]
MTATDTWTKVKLSDVADIGWGDLSVTKKSYVEHGFTAFSATGADGFLPYYDYDEEGIVISAIGANCGKIWRTHGKWSCIKNTMRILIKDSPVTLDYLFYFLSDPNVFPKRGSGQPFISKEDARDIEITYPPVNEQLRIVELLENHFSCLDSALIYIKQAKSKASQFRRSILQAAFTGNLNSNQQHLKMKIPSEWRQERFGDLFKVKYGKAIDKSLRMEFAEYPVVGSAGVMTYTKTPLTVEPTIVIGRKGNVGSIQIFKEGCYPIDTTYYMSTISEFDIDFLTYQLTSLDLVRLDSSTATPSLRREDLENVVLVIPPMEEQLKIVAQVENLFLQLEAATETADAMEKQSNALRRSLLHSALTGQLTKGLLSV